MSLSLDRSKSNTFKHHGTPTHPNVQYVEEIVVHKTSRKTQWNIRWYKGSWRQARLHPHQNLLIKSYRTAPWPPAAPGHVAQQPSVPPAWPCNGPSFSGQVMWEYLDISPFPSTHPVWNCGLVENFHIIGTIQGMFFTLGGSDDRMSDLWAMDIPPSWIRVPKLRGRGTPMQALFSVFSGGMIINDNPIWK